MENNEIMTNEAKTNEIGLEEVETVEETTNESENGIGLVEGTVIVGAICAAVFGVVKGCKWVYKKVKPMIEENRTKRATAIIEKAGGVVSYPKLEEELEDDSVFESEEIEESTENE